ncbi:carbohydrate ABC transporter permease [Caldicoprobacter faecalis]|uniref:Carbohydrate ABC transporter membrane protein 1, CUT1 family n=1 Tax=Caldicoprobacter faecalis TaxID=937334 RepID=A0A1I5W8W9_9FIRM|nr:sugar ABC transporter permease [Caldicoprobacter faecalis]SFQ16101.1 carbohydrate ABC transporter membrane protein 1, CUT1 family [Caldicoprobacter faecalis]
MAAVIIPNTKIPIKTRISYAWAEVKRNKVSYMFLAPYALIFTVFTVIPVLVSMGLSFTYFSILEPPKWIGFQNYINLLLDDEVFLIALKNTFLFAAITGPIGYFAALFFAWMINELPPKIRAIMVVIFYAPTISGQAYIIWNTLFSGDAYGYINSMLIRFGIIYEPIQWLTDPSYMRTAAIIVVLWMSLGTGFLSFIAGLQSIDNTLYESGYVDGIQNRWQELWYITLPSMKPQLLFGAVMSITSSFAIHEILVPLVGFPSTDYAAHTVVSHLVDYGNIRFEMGTASAIATLLFIAMVGTNWIVQRLLRKVGN